MIIDFKSMKGEKIKNFHGGDGEVFSNMFVDDMNRIMYGKLKSGDSIGFHKHKTESEIVYILKGEGKAIYNSEEEKLKAGVCHYCPKGSSHSIINNGSEELLFFAVVPKQ